MRIICGRQVRIPVSKDTVEGIPIWIIILSILIGLLILALVIFLLWKVKKKKFSHIANFKTVQSKHNLKNIMVFSLAQWSLTARRSQVQSCVWTWVLSVWTLHALLLFTWDFSRYSRFLPQTKNVCGRVPSGPGLTYKRNLVSLWILLIKWSLITFYIFSYWCSS